jgi:hypothetical protein
MPVSAVVSAPAFLDTGNRKMKRRKPPGPTAADEKQAQAGATKDQAQAGASQAGASKDDIMRWVERTPLRSSATGPPSTASDASMTASYGPPKRDTAKKKARGRLDRSVLAMLGKGLEDCFDEVRRQDVPERFKLLLQQF